MTIWQSFFNPETYTTMKASMSQSHKWSSIKFILCSKCKGNLLKCKCDWSGAKPAVEPTTKSKTKWEVWSTDGFFVCVRETENEAVEAMIHYAPRWKQGLERREVPANGSRV